MIGTGIPRADRLLMLSYLLNKRAWTVNELATYFRVTRRTVLRDLATLGVAPLERAVDGRELYRLQPDALLAAWRIAAEAARPARRRSLLARRLCGATEP